MFRRLDERVPLLQPVLHIVDVCELRPNLSVENAPVFDWKAPVLDWEAPLFDWKALVFDSEALVFDWKAPVFDWEAPVFDWKVASLQSGRHIHCADAGELRPHRLQARERPGLGGLRAG